METNKYQNAKIYKLVDTAYNKCYIGSTTESLSKRIAHHRSNYTASKIGKYYGTCKAFDLFDEYGVNGVKIELIEEYPCQNNMQLLKREGEQIKNTVCINKCIPGQTRSERECKYKESNSEKLSEWKRKYRESHRDRINDAFICSVCNGTYSRSNKAKHERSQKHQQALTKPDELENYDETII